MITKIDWDELKNNNDYLCYAEKLGYIFNKATELSAGRTVIMSEIAAYFFEGYDTGVKDWNHINDLAKIDPRCSRGYYAKFFVCSLLKGFSIMLAGETVDMIQVINFDPKIELDERNFFQGE